MQRFTTGLVRLLASRKFFIFVIALFAFEALWLVFSFSYAMLWDEYYHFGLIQFYAHHLSPFLTHQPHSADIYGEITRYPKYLYHYLMSFPLRGIMLFTHDKMTQVIILRVINVAMFAGGLVAFRAVLLRIVKSRALVHLVLFVLAMLPMTSLLAAQINYDNLQFLLTGLVFYWALRFIQTKKFEVKWLALAIGVGLLACEVKYTFLPLLVAVIIFLAYFVIKKYGKRAPGRVAVSWKQMSRWAQIGMVVLLVLGAGLFIERIGVNVARYHKINPGCKYVLSVERCLSFSPFKRDYINRHHNNGADLMGPVKYAESTWFGDLYNQYFSTGTRIAYAKYTVAQPLPIPYTTILVAMIITGVCLLAGGWRVFKLREVQLAALGILLLAAALFYTNYTGYLKNGQPTAIQGRYLLPIIPLVLGISVLAVRKVVRWRRPRAILAALLIAGLLAGGGLITHVVRSGPKWYWHNQTVRSVNNSVGDKLSFLKI